ncbi:MotA/TolQ/ExbB proton channel family protein [Candidatus Binatia bacterium]|nr:MotA/TolQ/ExbB proton channel family protein [Candidatus Binatia bacterium]
MTFSYMEIWEHMGAPAIVIAVVLLTMGLASLTVFLERLFTLRRSRATSKAFAAVIADKMRAADVDGILADAQADEHARGHLTRVVRAGLTMYVHARQTADISGLSASERTRRHLERYLEEVGEDLRRGMSVLASVGSVAPFVGLLGTVVGIISAFQGIAASGSGGLSSVSAGISEALIETALGLAVAIPAVLAFNFLSTQIAHDEGKLQRSAGELLDMVEDWEERSVQSGGMRRERVA